MTTKQRAALRSMGAVMEPVLHIGKEGITPTVIKQCWDALEARELIKVQVQDGSGLDSHEAADMLAERLGAEVVQVIGHKFTLYRVSSREDAKHIELD